MTIVKLENINKKIGSKVILEDVNLSVERGTILGLSGPNGAGKSMIFNTIIGFLKPDTGTVTVNDKKVRDEVFFSDDVAFSMDNVGISEKFSGKKNLELIYLLNNKENDSGKIQSLLSYVGLDPEDNRKVRDYSLGMKKRLSLAVALMSESPILILDEPSNALDDDGRIFLKKMITDQKKRGTTILISNHDKDFLNDVCDEIISISEGKII